MANSKGINQFTAKEPILKESPYLSYILGVLEGDGFIYKVRRKRDNKFDCIIQLAATDKDFVENFNKNLEKIFSRKAKIISYKLGNSLFYRVSLRSKIFYNWYISKTKEQIYKIASKYPTEFIKGIFDSEGSIVLFKSKQNKYPVIRIINSDLNLLKFVSVLLSEMRIKSTIGLRRAKQTIIEDRKCNFKKYIYCLGIFKKDDVLTFLNKNIN